MDTNDKVSITVGMDGDEHKPGSAFETALQAFIEQQMKLGNLEGGAGRTTDNSIMVLFVLPKARRPDARLTGTLN